MITLAADLTSEEMAVFFEDTDDQLRILDKGLVILRQGIMDGELLADSHRAAHTIKGSAAMLGYPPMARLAEAIETALGNISGGTLSVTGQLVDALGESTDALVKLEDNLKTLSESDIDPEGILVRLEGLIAAI